ncbi:penicillin amidase [Clostridium sp. chh4-2]|uniref:linear amide C-N hydrolase n=1 Tax=Clostridium sp. chh4-2 TaxID=2067550 RepID=UPI000CCF7466|nr:choloylglycine hydrolase family protein [Clostridium sp. chh4-2]PNV59364.1 penicillin amidase [Clostridium sp. chh4-2]
MCTAAMIKNSRGDVFFGRTMDFSYPLAPHVYKMPPNYEWINTPGTFRLKNRYGYIGTGQDISKIIFADGVNEAGLAAAVLYFPGYARYHNTPELEGNQQVSVAAVELVNFLLGMCSSVHDAATLLPTVRITGAKDSITNSIAPLHWIIADKTGACITVEPTEAGLQILDNPIGVLSNSPGFQWHMTNLRNYMNLTTSQQKETQWDNVPLTPFGQGAGSLGLPGDYTPPSRFVRTAFLKSHTTIPDDKDAAITACFHILESVTIPKGPVITPENTADYTQYTAFLNLSTPEYYAKSYTNSQIIQEPLSPINTKDNSPLDLGPLIRPIKFPNLIPTQ